MKAMLYRKFGLPEVLRLEDVDKPTPKGHDILIRVRATPLSFGDVLVRDFKAVTPRKFHMPFLFWIFAKFYFGFGNPKIRILGSEFSGEVEAVGPDVKRFRPGDPVFGFRGPLMGAYAEYLCMPEDGVVAAKPVSMSFEEAAAVPYGALMALSVLRKARLQPGQSLLVNGASGGIGPFVVQLARSHFGANVTGVCGTPRLEYVRALGAEKVIDYTQEDFTVRDETYDVIVDILGKNSFARCKRALKPGGRCLYVSFKMKKVFRMLWTSLSRRRKVVCVVSSEKAEDLALIKELAEAGKFRTIIDRCFPLAQAAEAHQYYEQGHRKGSVVITIAPSIAEAVELAI
jgi:NADPH:quinone reductase-like Zn-dependent oxidoreductase